MKNTNWKLVAIIAAIAIAFIVLIIGIGVSTEAKAYSMEEQIHESQSGIDVQLKKLHKENAACMISRSLSVRYSHLL